jgi:hypothetical protein
MHAEKVIFRTLCFFLGHGRFAGWNGWANYPAMGRLATIRRLYIIPVTVYIYR